MTEIPYMVNKARLIENIADLVKDKRIEGISDLNDESNREGMRIVIELKREANPQVVLNQLYRYTQLQDTVGVIMLALDGGVPKGHDAEGNAAEISDFQSQVVRRRTNFDLKKAEERAHILKVCAGPWTLWTRSLPPSAAAKAARLRQKPPSWTNSSLTIPRPRPL